MSDSFVNPSRRLRRLLPASLAVAVALGFATISVAPAQAAEADDEVVLPSRVANSIQRTLNALDRAERRIEDGRYPGARRSLSAVSTDILRAHRAGTNQMTAVPPLDDEGDPVESTSGPDSVVAVLTLEQTAVTRLAGMLDGVTGHPLVVSLVGAGISTAQTSRDQMLTAVIGLDPEGAGADYADGMADTLDGYTDEVANLTESLQTDQLSAPSQAVVSSALAGSQAAEAKVTAAFGGGE
jgi:hypothetical protein